MAKFTILLPKHIKLPKLEICIYDKNPPSEICPNVHYTRLIWYATSFRYIQRFMVGVVNLLPARYLKLEACNTPH